MDGPQRELTGDDWDRHYTGLCYAYNVLPYPGGLMQQPTRWVDKLARWLPYHEDQHFLKLQAVAHGRYEPTAPPSDEKTPEGARSRLTRARNRAVNAIRTYRSQRR